MKIVLDFETQSLTDLVKRGLENYIKCPTTRIYLMSWMNVEDEKVHTLKSPEYGDNPKSAYKAWYDVSVAARNGDLTIIAHNASFEEQFVLNKINRFLLDCDAHVLDNREKIKYECTSIASQIDRGPKSLEKAAKFYGCPVQKDLKGQQLMLKVCKGQEKEPNARTKQKQLAELSNLSQLSEYDLMRSRIINAFGFNKTTSTLGILTYWYNNNGVWYRAGDNIGDAIQGYCETDVKTTYELSKQVLPIKVAREVEGAKLTDKMNKKGVYIDELLLTQLEQARDHHLEEFDKFCQINLGVEKHTKRAALVRAFNGLGIPIESLSAGEIKRVLKTVDLSDSQRELLEGYTKRNKSSLAKIAKARDTMCEGKLRGLFKFCGASATGRWSSFGFQLQNLPRPVFGYEDAKRQLPDPEAAQSLLRSIIIPKAGRRFFITDLSQIELRVALYHGGYQEEVDKLHAGGDLYVDFAATAYGTTPEAITSEQRNMGKACMLSLQYGTGAATLQHTCNELWGGNIDILEAENFVDRWREKYNNIVAQWTNYDEMIEEAYRKNERLIIPLKSGRVLDYRKLRYDYPNDKARYMTYQYYDGTKWVSFWGGTVFQHVVQAESRDILLIKMLDFDKRGFDLVMTIHDEVVAEVDAGMEPKRNWDESGMKEIESIWPGLKLASESKIEERYGK